MAIRTRSLRRRPRRSSGDPVRVVGVARVAGIVLTKARHAPDETAFRAPMDSAVGHGAEMQLYLLSPCTTEGAARSRPTTLCRFSDSFAVSAPPSMSHRVGDEILQHQA